MSFWFKDKTGIGQSSSQKMKEGPHSRPYLAMNDQCYQMNIEEQLLNFVNVVTKEKFSVMAITIFLLDINFFSVPIFLILKEILREILLLLTIIEGEIVQHINMI